MLRIRAPFHGAVLNGHLGELRDGALRIRVEGDCPAHGTVEVNGVPATIAGGSFSLMLDLTERVTDIVAAYAGAHGRLEHSVRVLWDRGSFPRYRVLLDDTSFSLREIARESRESIFDCHFFALLRRLHEGYGTKFSANLYYKADDGFRLRDFPSRYRAEWEECASWLGLTFHAYADKPDRPYQYASPEKLMADLELVREEIVRFAGEGSWIPPTVIHWGMVSPDALPHLRQGGTKVLSGYFTENPWGYDVHYWLDPPRAEYLSRHDALVDWDSGIVFSRVDMVVNSVRIEDIVPTLEAAVATPERAEIVDLLTHEQYFFRHYPAYIPDHPERLETAIRWVTERGYRPVFFHEGFLGADET